MLLDRARHCTKEKRNIENDKSQNASNPKIMLENSDLDTLSDTI